MIYLKNFVDENELKMPNSIKKISVNFLAWNTLKWKKKSCSSIDTKLFKIIIRGKVQLIKFFFFLISVFKLDHLRNNLLKRRTLITTTTIIIASKWK